ERLEELAEKMTTAVRSVTVARDDEHNAYYLDVEDRSHGYPRRFALGIDFITAGEYRTLLAAYREIHEVRFPVVVKTLAPAREDDGEAPTASADETAIGGAPLDDPTKLAAEPRDRVAEAVGARPPKKEGDVTLGDIDAFVEFFITAGKK